MNLTHLGLPVRDERRSLEFYRSYFGFDPDTAQTYPDGTTIVRNPAGFDLALHPAAEVPSDGAGFLHFGFRLPDPMQVRDLRARLAADGVEVVEADDGPELVSFKCLDPDGWRVEVYWEP